ncbi:MAG: type I phosphomannose isomerase catalytic subunit [Candidatus Velthaea sp.]
MKTAQPNTALYPWQLDPKLAPAIWGGGELVREYGKHGDPQAKLGESWECWDADAVTNGAVKGSTLAMLRERLGAAFLGDLDPTQIFPVLTKIITAHEWLSVQVHPNDAYAQRVEHRPVGKTECWYVMAARADAELVVGWTRDTSRAEYEERVGNGTLAEILRKVPVKAGDTVYVPSGMVHAIGPGVTVFETQQAISPIDSSTGTAWGSTDSRASCTSRRQPMSWTIAPAASQRSRRSIITSRVSTGRR